MISWVSWHFARKPQKLNHGRQQLRWEAVHRLRWNWDEKSTHLAITLAAVAAAAAKLLQSCPTLCDPIDGSPPGSPVPGILQARTLDWVAISSSNAWKWKVKVHSLSCVQLLATPWTAAHQAPLSMRFSRQEYWSGVPSPSLGCSWQGAKTKGWDAKSKGNGVLAVVLFLFQEELT